MLHRSNPLGNSLATGLRPIGEILPHSTVGRHVNQIIDVEWRLIASLLIDPNRRAEINLSVDPFCDPLARAVITTMLSLEAEGQAVDVRSVSHRLDAAGHDSRAYRRRLAKTLAEDIDANLAADFWGEITGEVNP